MTACCEQNSELCPG